MRILKRIPCASRHLAASKLASILVDVSPKNDSESWGRLFNFSSRCLAVPKRGSHRRSLASAVNVQLPEESDPLLSQFRQSSKHHFPRDSVSNLVKRVSSKLEEGDVRGAVRIASSEDTLAELNEETVSALRAKHPQPPGSCFPLAPAVNTSLPFLAEVEIVQAIRSFPSTSAGGADGLRPQHLVDLTSAPAERGGRELLTALSSFILHILEGNTPTIQPIFFGTNLIALNKKEGGIRPIAVGQTLRRLVAKCASGLMMRSSEISFAPRQLAYGTSLGCEAAVHAARCYVESISSVPNKLMLKLDFKNAFNSLRRDKMLQSVNKFAPAFSVSCNQLMSHLACSVVITFSSPQKACSRVIQWVPCFSAFPSTI